MENAEFVGAKCLTISTSLDCSRNYVRGECFLFVSLVTNRVSLEEECLPSFEVLNLTANCLHIDNEIPMPCVLVCRPFF